MRLSLSVDIPTSSGLPAGTEPAKRGSESRARAVSLDMSELDGKKIGLKAAGGIAELIDRDAGCVENRQQQVGHGRFIGIHEVLAGLELTPEAAGEQAGQIEVPVQIAVAHAAPVQDQAAVKQ